MHFLQLSSLLVAPSIVLVVASPALRSTSVHTSAGSRVPASSTLPASAVDVKDHTNLLGQVLSAAKQDGNVLNGVGDKAVKELGSQLDELLSSVTHLDLLSDLGHVLTSLIPKKPTQPSQTTSAATSATPNPAEIVQVLGQLIGAVLNPNNVGDLIGFVEKAATGENNLTNINPNPPYQIYPEAIGFADAPYSVSEQQLREAIHIPPTFQYGAEGAPQPIILVPGTGNTGYITFIGNYIPLLTNSSIADPVWLNIPGYLLNDAQVNSEYVAYAINYIYAVSHQRDIAVLSWSQGGFDAQWAYKYWPSTREKVTDQIAISPDYHGTVESSEGGRAPPAVIQQAYNSNFIKTLRSDEGDSAYVPTTVVYSAFIDEIVEPQQGTNASAYLLDARNVGVSDNEVQSICPLQPGGSIYTHEGVLYNPIGFALLKDALANPGPGLTSRIPVQELCGDYLSPGLNLADLLLTENAILIAGLEILGYPSDVTSEPPIMSYAQNQS